jgi:hypothetical protein
MRSTGLLVALMMSVPLLAAPPRAALMCPHDTGHAWRATHTAHIRLATDVAPERVVALAQELEDIHNELAVIAPLALLGQKPAVDGVVDVTAFRDNAALEELGRVGMLGYVLRDHVVVLDVNNDQILRHELTHHVVTRLIGAAPRWVDEGIAEYLATATIDEGHARVGDIPDRIKTLGGRGTSTFAGRAIPKLRELLAAPDAEFDRSFGLYYAAAWTLVHLVNNEHPEHRPRFRAYLQALSRGVAPDQAWQRSFGPVLAMLEQQYDQFLANICVSGAFETGTNLFTGMAAVAHSGTPVTPTLMSDGEVHAQWLAVDSGSDDERLTRARSALPHDPDAFDLRYAISELEQHSHPEAAAAELNALAKLRPNDERILLGRVEQGLIPRPRAGVDAAAARLTRGAHDPPSLAVIGLYWLLAKQDLRQAFSFAKRGIDIDRGCGACWLVLTYVYVGHGQLDDARMAFGHTLAMFDRRQPLPPELATLRAQLARLHAGN